LEQRAFSLKEVASILGVHPETIRRAVKAGKLKAAKIGKDYRIAKPELERYFHTMGGGRLFEDNDSQKTQ
jgi:excisionase family DNA binding protein